MIRETLKYLKAGYEVGDVDELIGTVGGTDVTGPPNNSGDTGCLEESCLGSVSDDIDGGLPDEPDAMPFVERIADIPSQGAPVDLVDNTAIIDAKLAAYNQRSGWNGKPVPEGENPSGDSPAGCGCTQRAPATGWLWLSILGVLGVARRRP